MEFSIDQKKYPAQVSVPVGSIISYIGNLQALPANWAFCDGRLINNPDSPFNGHRLPNLTDDCFLMGFEAANRVGQAGGNNAIPIGGEHQHDGATGAHAGYMSGQINFDRRSEITDQFKPQAQHCK